MNIKFERIPFDDIWEEVRTHLAGLPSAIDGFLESHIRESSHYRAKVEGDVAGFASIHAGSLITQFALRPAFRQHGQDAFAELRRMESVTAALLATGDEWYLSHAIDSYRELRKQGFLFACPPDFEPVLSGDVSLQPAQVDDAVLIATETGDFFQPLEDRLERDELYLVRRGDAVVAFGIVERSELLDATGSIGMFAIERFRGQGVGTATIRLLIAECRRQGIRPVAGCWYYNHASKKTLERAGMYAASRLLRVEY